MSKHDPGTLLDGYGLITGGVDSKTPPQLLLRTTFAWASNVSFRENLPACRPGWVQRDLQFLDTDGNENEAVRTAFEGGLWQGAIGFERARQLVVSVAGRLFAIQPDTWMVQDVTPDAAVSMANPTLSRTWFAEVEDFIIRQDGQSAAWIYDGSSTRPSDAAGRYGPKEIPGGTAMVYSQGRLIVATADGRSFVVGDIVGGPSGTAQYGYRDAVLHFTENDIIALGGSFSIPINAGTITALRPVAQVDTSLGQGPTQIFSTNGIFSLNTPSDRATWKTLNYPIQTFSVVQAGSTSDRATMNVNGDIWLRALDGVRSFQVARRDFGSWTNTPQSTEVVRALKWDDQELLGYASSALFDNRLLMTTRPYQVQGHGVAHRGLVALDFSPVASLGSQAKPVWEGVWCGLRVLQILHVTWGFTTRCFIFALSPENKIQLWELTRDAIADQPLSADPTPVIWFAETGGYSFPDLGFDLKKLLKGWVWFDGIQGECSVAFQWRSNGAPRWYTWHQWSFCSTMTTCGTEACTPPSNLQPQTRFPYLLPDANPACDPTTQGLSTIGTWFQVKITGSGSMRVPKLEMVAQDVQQAVHSLCPSTEACRVANECPDDGFGYSSQ